MLEGPLGDGVEGILALYTYEEKHSDGEGGQDTDSYHYTVGIAEVPECLRLAPELYCQRKFGLRALEGLEDVFRSKKRVEFESEALTERYEIFANPDLQDFNWLRQLFSPSFIVWLTDSAPEKFAFEFVGGHLCCYVHGQLAQRRRARLDARRDHRGRHPAAPGGRGVGIQKPARRTSALAISAAAIISRTEGTRTSATTSWIFGAARAAASSTSRRWSRRSAVAWRLS